MLWQAERFLYASILAHPCFERSLSFVLANRLTSATLLATQLMDVFDGVFMTDPFIRQAIRLDVQVSNGLLILGLTSDP
jgi:serine O-acetyltransferase